MTATLEQLTTLAIDATSEVEMPTQDAQVASTVNTTFTSRDLPWMQLGPRIDQPVTAEVAAQLGGLDFDVEMRSLSYQSGDRRVGIPSRKAMVRIDTDEFLSVVSSDYKPVQYSEAFSFLDSINPLVSSAGALSGGRKGFIVVQMPNLENLTVSNAGVEDPHDLYVVVQTSHDLSKAVEVAVMPLRTKCMNMLGLPSLTTGAQQKWSIKHVGDVRAKLDEAQKTLSRVTRYAEVYANTVRQLSSVSVDRDTIDIVLKMVLKDRPKRDEQISAITHTFTHGELVRPNDDVGGRNGWDFVNAVSDYYQWGRNTGTRTPQSMFTSGLNGDTYKAVSRTAQLLLARA